MKNDKRYYTVKVTKSGSSYSAELYEGSTHIGATQKLGFNKNVDDMKKTDHYELNFKIDDSALPQGESARFISSNDDVLSVWKDTASCPPQGNYMSDTLWVDKNKNGKELRLINMDLKTEEIRFQLFMQTNGTPPVTIELDPIINNGNNGAPEGLIDAFLACIITGGIVGLATSFLVGGETFVASTGLLYGIGGAVVGAIIGFIADRMS